MGLLKKLTSKLKQPKEFKFENFGENFEQNQKFLQIQFKKMLKGFNVIVKRKEIDFYMPNIFDEIDEFILDIMEITNSECFSYNFAHIVTCAKMYAVNYMATDEGKTEGEICYAVQRLSEMIDCLNFNYLSHINCETNFEAIYQDDNIYVDKDSYASELVQMVNSVNTIILSIAQGIFDRDRSVVLEGYMDLHNKELYKLKPSSEDIFGL